MKKSPDSAHKTGCNQSGDWDKNKNATDSTEFTDFLNLWNPWNPWRFFSLCSSPAADSNKAHRLDVNQAFSAELLTEDGKLA